MNQPFDPAGTPAAADDRFAPPQATLVDTPETYDGMELASRGQRFAAALIDGILQGGVVWGAIYLIAPGGMLAYQRTHVGVTVALGLLSFLVLHGWLIATASQTIGKRLLGLRIMHVSGDRAGFARIVGLRTLPQFVVGIVPLLSALYGLVDCCMIFRASRRMLHDEIASTVVTTVAAAPRAA